MIGGAGGREEQVEVGALVRRNDKLDHANRSGAMRLESRTPEIGVGGAILAPIRTSGRPCVVLIAADALHHLLDIAGVEIGQLLPNFWRQAMRPEDGVVLAEPRIIELHVVRQCQRMIGVRERRIGCDSIGRRRCGGFGGSSRRSWFRLRWLRYGEQARRVCSGNGFVGCVGRLDQDRLGGGSGRLRWSR